MHVALILAVIATDACMLQSPAPEPAAGSAALWSQGPPPRRYSVSLGLAYQPGPGPRVMGQFSARLDRESTVTVSAGWSGQVFGGIALSRVFDLDPRGRSRLMVVPSFFSDFEPGLRLAGLETSERRTGANLALTWQQMLPTPWQAAYTSALEVARVRLDDDETDVVRTTITTIDLGPRLVRVARGAALPVDRIMEARILVGSEGSPADGLFLRARAGGRLTRPLSSWSHIDTEARAEWYSSGTPLYTRAPIGGASSVRGYRPDVEIGQGVAVLQQEIWIGLPADEDDRARPGAIARRLRAAAFFDIGATTGVASDRKGPARLGAGIGARLFLGGMTLRADWGHALLDRHTAPRLGALFVSVRPDLELFFR